MSYLEIFFEKDNLPTVEKLLGKELKTDEHERILSAIIKAGEMDKLRRRQTTRRTSPKGRASRRPREKGAFATGKMDMWLNKDRSLIKPFSKVNHPTVPICLTSYSQIILQLYGGNTLVEKRYGWLRVEFDGTVQGAFLAWENQVLIQVTPSCPLLLYRPFNPKPDLKAAHTWAIE